MILFNGKIKAAQNGYSTISGRDSTRSSWDSTVSGRDSGNQGRIGFDWSQSGGKGDAGGNGLFNGFFSRMFGSIGGAFAKKPQSTMSENIGGPNALANELNQFQNQNNACPPCPCLPGRDGGGSNSNFGISGISSSAGVTPASSGTLAVNTSASTGYTPSSSSSYNGSVGGGMA